LKQNKISSSNDRNNMLILKKIILFTDF